MIIKYHCKVQMFGSLIRTKIQVSVIADLSYRLPVTLGEKREKVRGREKGRQDPGADKKQSDKTAGFI